MALWFLLVLIGIPIAEIAVFIEAGEHVGLWPTVGAILATAAIGMLLIRMQGLAVLRRAQELMAQEKFPGQEIFDGVCLLLAGGCLITPGFLTDTFGFLLLIIPLRRWVGQMIWRHVDTSGFAVRSLGRRNSGGAGRDGSVVIDGEFHDLTDGDRSGADDKPQLIDTAPTDNDNNANNH